MKWDEFESYSEISISVIVKRVWTCNISDLPGHFVRLGDLLSFPVSGETEKIAGLWFAREISTQADKWYLSNICWTSYTDRYTRGPWGIFRQSYPGDIDVFSDQPVVWCDDWFIKNTFVDDSK